MAIRLGEMLVKAGKISPEQLDEALRGQVIFGGRLGTNLIELGYLKEDDIAKFLSDKLGVPYVNPDELMQIPAELIQLFPRELVERYRVIPLNLDKKKLTLVMEDPSDLAAIDEISFRTGLIIRPVITPEVRLVAALEKYYQIQRELRYIPVGSHFREEWKSARAKPASAPRQPAHSQVLGATAETEEIMELEVLEELPEEGGLITLETFSRSLTLADDRDEIAEMVLSYVGQELKGCALLLVRGGTVTGWRGMREGKPIDDFPRFQGSLAEPSVLNLVAEGKSFYLGTPAATPVNIALQRATRATRPVSACLIPLLMMGRVVNILYADDAGGEMAERLAPLQKVMSKAAMAFEILILKNKIMQG